MRLKQVCLGVTLRDRVSSRTLAVITTHLKADKTAAGEAVRAQQIERVLEFASQLCATTDGGVLCADLNARPDSGRADEADTYRPLVYPALVSHALKLRSAYTCERLSTALVHAASPAESAAAEPAYTTWKLRSKGEAKMCIDFVFFTAGSLRCVQLLGIPEEAEVEPERFPSLQYPSDHVALGADLMFCED
eukprot:m.34136 g.34136  ORF g.34136 m.34136 type:complete len:192 (+) comp12998_c0_seq1:319-894(+)